jgi:phage regulator Rha-like protein
MINLKKEKTDRKKRVIKNIEQILKNPSNYSVRTDAYLQDYPDICKELIDKGFESGNPYSGYVYNDNQDTLTDVAKFFGMVVVDLDVEFFSKFLEMNDETLSQIFETKDKTLYDKLIIPQSKKFKINYPIY